MTGGDGWLGLLGNRPGLPRWQGKVARGREVKRALDGFCWIGICAWKALIAWHTRKTRNVRGTGTCTSDGRSLEPVRTGVFAGPLPSGRIPCSSAAVIRTSRVISSSGTIVLSLSGCRLGGRRGNAAGTRRQGQTAKNVCQRAWPWPQSGRRGEISMSDSDAGGDQIFEALSSWMTGRGWTIPTPPVLELRRWPVRIPRTNSLGYQARLRGQTGKGDGWRASLHMQAS